MYPKKVRTAHIQNWTYKDTIIIKQASRNELKILYHLYHNHYDDISHIKYFYRTLIVLDSFDIQSVYGNNSNTQRRHNYVFSTKSNNEKVSLQWALKMINEGEAWWNILSQTHNYANLSTGKSPCWHPFHLTWNSCSISKKGSMAKHSIHDPILCQFEHCGISSLALPSTRLF